MIISIKNIFLASLGIFQFTGDRFKEIHEEFVYKEGKTYYMQKIFIMKSTEKVALKDLVERGGFLIDFMRLKEFEFRNEIVISIKELINEFFDIKSYTKKKIKNRKDKKMKGLKKNSKSFI